ncbi:cyclic AMP-dependent transcription factor ATF-6 alpha isoform X2 [Melanaphis sacchari]|uniref:cyclic AMP-dependent transcription factor ATF-6 alpha isoform X2 n=1 Tax=Melanaphis sacchari TaxID=742174 RepID=UPI000DC132D6|nr:cyclic AMP-dependent transcription factor ATF-6 alpha isoform X2 [Melanaphis sacchari]
MPNKDIFYSSDPVSSGMMDVLVEPKDKLFEFDELKMEPLSPYFGDDIKFNTGVSDLDSDYMMQWNIESCLGNGIDLEKDSFKSSPPSSPSNESMPSGDSQSSFDSNQILPKILSSNMKNINAICDTNTVFAIKSMNGSKTFPKLKISPAPIKPSFNAASRTNNNFNVSSMLTDQTNQSPVTISKSFASTLPRKIILTQDQFSKITKLQKQKQIDLNIPTATPLVSSTSEVNTQLTLPVVEIDSAKSKNSTTTLQYNQLSAIKRHQRMIRNREAASLSRKKKKEYVTSLEEKICVLEKENLELKIENSALKERLKIFDKLSSITDRPFIKKAKKATVILSVVLMISLNIVPSGIFNIRQFDKSEMQINLGDNYNTKNVENINFHSRNLLWVNDFEDSNSSLNATEHLMCPTFINVSESKRIDSELRKWIEPKNLKLLNDNLSMVYVEPPIISTTIEHSKHNEYIRNKVKKMERSQKRNFKKRKHVPSNNDFIEIFGQLKLDSKESLFDSIERQDDTFYVVSFSGDHLLLPASHNASNTTLRPKMSLVFPTLSSNGSDFVTMIQIDCAVTDTKTLHIRDTHLRHNDFKNNGSSNLKQHNDHRNNIAHKPYFIRQSYSGSMFSKMNHELPSY